MLSFQLTPCPELRTARLLLRRITAEDAPALLRMLSDPEVMRYIGREPAKTLQEVQALCARIEETRQKNEGLMFGLALLAEPQALIGTCGLWRLDAENHRAELGYMLAPAHQGRGLISEAISAVCRHGFESLQLHSIEAHVDPANAASVRVLERTGFVREGLFRECVRFRDRFSDNAVYSLLAPA